MQLPQLFLLIFYTHYQASFKIFSNCTLLFLSLLSFVDLTILWPGIIILYGRQSNCRDYRPKPRILPCVLPVEFFWSSSEESEEVLSGFRQSHILHHPVRYPLSPASHCRMKLFRYSNYHIRPNPRHFYRLYILTGLIYNSVYCHSSTVPLISLNM